jgi:VanZ family protein
MFLIAGFLYLAFHFYAMGFNPQHISLHAYVSNLDKLEHFTSGAIIAGLMIGFTEKRKMNIHPFIFLLITLFLAIIFEILEYFTIYWGGPFDSILDILFGLLGASVTVACNLLFSCEPLQNP